MMMGSFIVQLNYFIFTIIIFLLLLVLPIHYLLFGGDSSTTCSQMECILLHSAGELNHILIEIYPSLFFSLNLAAAQGLIEIQMMKLSCSRFHRIQFDYVVLRDIFC